MSFPFAEKCILAMKAAAFALSDADLKVTWLPIIEVTACKVPIVLTAWVNLKDVDDFSEP